MATRRRVVMLAALLVLPYTLLGTFTWALFSTANGLAFGLGVGLVIAMALGLWAVVADLHYGFRVEGLGKRLAEQDLLPDLSTLPRRPSGRIDPAAADAWYDERKAELDADPTNWRCWYRVAIAYDIAGDRSRARDSMRQAIRLSARSGDGSPATSG